MPRISPGCSPRCCKGWAEPAMLDAYQAERQPITDQVSQFAFNMSQGRSRISAARFRPTSSATTKSGEATRARDRQGGLRSLCPAAVLRRAELRLFLRGLADHRLRRRSRTRPIRWASSTRRRCRAAARRISGCATAARSTTRWAQGYGLLRFDGRVAVDGLVAAAKTTRYPARGSRHRRWRNGNELYASKLVLVRPDRHVAWRADAAPDDPLGLVDHCVARACVDATVPRLPRR